MACGAAQALEGRVMYRSCLLAPSQESPWLLAHLPLCELSHDSAWNPNPIAPSYPAPLFLWPRLPGRSWPTPPLAPVSLADPLAPGTRLDLTLTTRLHLGLTVTTRKSFPGIFPVRNLHSSDGLSHCQLLFQHIQCGQGGEYSVPENSVARAPDLE